MTARLTGRRIVLTGVSRGVGLCSARLLLDEGAEVLGISRGGTRLVDATRELTERAPGRFDSLALELESPDAATSIRERVEELWGGMDVLVHNAGVMLANGSISSEPDGALEKSLDINLLAPFRITRALAPLLEASSEPRVVNVSSGAGTLTALADAGIAGYRLSKWALNGLTLLQAQEYKGRISVIALDPGWVKTDLGGPDAPGVPEESAQGLLAALSLPWTTTGLFLKDGKEISW